MRSEHTIINSQIGDADLVVLSKVGEVSPDQVQQVTSSLEKLTPDVRVLPFDETLPAHIFLTQAEPTIKEPTDQEHHHVHQSYQMYVYTTNSPLNILKLQQYLTSLPKEIIRIKGVVHCSDENGEKFAVRIQRAGAHIAVEEIEEIITDNAQPAESTILFIGTSFDEAAWVRPCSRPVPGF